MSLWTSQDRVQRSRDWLWADFSSDRLIHESLKLQELESESGLVINLGGWRSNSTGASMENGHTLGVTTSRGSPSSDMTTSEEREDRKSEDDSGRKLQSVSIEKVDARPSTPPNRELNAPSSDDPGGSDEEDQEAKVADDDEDDDDDDDEEEEPKLKYARLTSNLGGLYRNGDATSTFVVAGDKMIIGTHNGNVHVLSLPSLRSIKFYHAHSASVTAVSVSPFTVPIPSDASFVASLKILPQGSQKSPAAKINPGSTSSPAGKTKQPQVVAPIPSNQIHIATSSIDGKVCITSLVDPKDVLLRDFGRPVQAVALSPEYKSDRAYLSGGLAGKLMLTVGGRPGVSSKSITGGAAAAVPGWLGSIGLGAGTEKDTVLHSGEGAISTIRWSPSGKHVVWINEQGIKIMRSNVKLESIDADHAWKRISHVDRPDGPGWEEMSGVWKGHAEWIDEEHLETHEQPWMRSKSEEATTEVESSTTPKRANNRKRIEKVVVGWGGTVWIIHVHPGGPGTGKHVGERTMGSAEIIAILRMDCIISGLTLYTPTLILILAYIVPDESEEEKGLSGHKKKPSKGKEASMTRSPGTPSGGIQRRKRGLPPELRLIDLTTSEELSADTLSVSRSESLSAADYHLGVLPALQINARKVALARGAFEGLGDGLWAASINATKIFSSAASMVGSDGRSEGESYGKETMTKTSSTDVSRSQLQQQLLGPQRPTDVHPALANNAGMKIFIHSPYDCVLATRRELPDHLEWLLGLHKYEVAWNLVNDHPAAVIVDSSNSSARSPSPSRTSTVRRKTSSEDFFADDASSSTASTTPAVNSAVEKEKRRIGELWVEQLIEASDWRTAGEVCGKVLTTSSRWEHWAWEFIRAKKFQEILSQFPVTQLQPALPSMIYEVFLGHYISHDRVRFQSLLDRWPPELFDVGSIIAAIRATLESDDSLHEEPDGESILGRDWRILTSALAKLLLADDRPREALRYYIRLHDADATMRLISEFHLVDAVADDVAGLILLRVSRSQLSTSPTVELEAATAEPIRLLVNEAHRGVVPPQTVIPQLEISPAYQPLLYFYLKSLWLGPSSFTTIDTIPTPYTRHIFQSSEDSSLSATTDGASLISPFGDLALTLFSTYSRPLFSLFLRTLPSSYTSDHAFSLASSLNFIPEQVYLLSSTGQTRRALFLIITAVDSVTDAISFCKEQNDTALWDDLLEYSMDKPRFIRGLLEEVGTAIDPVELVRRIPDGLEIEGLREGVAGLVREMRVQESISEGVARVWRGEVGEGWRRLRQGGERGIRVEVGSRRATKPVVSHANGDHARSTAPKPGITRPGHCVTCGLPFLPDEQDTLLAFPCSHTFHLSCLLPVSSSTPPPSTTTVRPSSPTHSPNSHARTTSPQPTNYTSFPPHTPHSSTFFSTLPTPPNHGVGAKVTRARLIRDQWTRSRSTKGARIKDTSLDSADSDTATDIIPMASEGCPALVHKEGRLDDFGP